MKVLFLTNWFPKEDNPNFGVFIHENACLIDSIKTIELSIVHVDIRNSNSILSTSFERIEQNDLTYFRLNIESVFYEFILHGHPFLKRLVYKELLKSMDLNSFDLIHSNVIQPIGMVGDYISRKINKPHVISEHWSKTNKFLRKSIYKNTAKDVYESASNIIVVSEFLKDQIASETAVSQENFTIIPNIISPCFFEDYNDRTSQEQIRLIAVASWKKAKNLTKRLDYILHLCKTIFSEREEFVLDIVGEGDWLEDLKPKFVEYLGDRVRFLGFQKKDALAKLLSKSDYLLHISNIETFGIVIAEALCQGTPVIASKVGAIPGLISNNNGLMVPNNLEDWEKVFTKKLPVFDNEQIKIEARKTFSSYSIEEAYLKVYQKALKSSVNTN